MMKGLTTIVGVVVVLIAVAVFAIRQPKETAPTNVHRVNTNVATVSPYDFSLTMKGSVFVPNEFSPERSQTVELQLDNQDDIAHNLKFTSLDFDSGPIAPKTKSTVVFTAPTEPGRYDFQNTLPGTEAQPMVGTMVIN